MCADIAIFDVSGIAHAGALHDPVAALLFAAPAGVKHSIINGRQIVRDGVLGALGWRTVKVSCIDWFRDPHEVLARIEQCARGA